MATALRVKNILRANIGSFMMPSCSSLIAVTALLLQGASSSSAGPGTAAPPEGREERVRVTYYVKHQPDRVEQLLARFHAVSDPKSAAYGDHLSAADVRHLQRPHPAHLRAVRAHIAAAGGVELDASSAQVRCFCGRSRLYCCCC